MNQIYILTRIATLCSLFFILFLSSCENTTFLPAKANRVTLSLGMQSNDISEAWTRALGTGSNTISHVDYAIMDVSGKIINPPWHKLMANSLVIEGLEAGTYSIVFFATTETKEDIPRPAEIDGHLTLINSNNMFPLNVDYLFKRLDFTVDGTTTSKDISVNLKRCVGRVEVDVIPTSSFLSRLITGVEISLDDDKGIYLRHGDVENSYSESGGSLKKLELKPDAAGFYSFPSATPFSGTITVKSKLFDDTPVENTYRFSNLEIEPGKVTHIKVPWKSPDAYGEMYISQSDYTDANSKEILKNETPAEIQKCEFYSNAPLQVKMKEDKKLYLRSYVPITVRGIKVMCRVKSISSEFFELAYYEEVPRFSESYIEPPIVHKDDIYKTESGKRIRIRKQSYITPADYEFKIVTDDRYMTKVMSINYPLLVSFNYPGPWWWGRHPDGSQNKNDPVNPPLPPYMARHASVLGVNFSYFFNSKEFEDAIKAKEQAGFVFCKDTAMRQHTKVPAEKLIQRARAVKKLVLGILNNVTNPEIPELGYAQGMSDLLLWPYNNSTNNLNTDYKTGEKMALKGAYYTNQYRRDVRYKNTLFHEYGHLMGFSHASTVSSFDNDKYYWQDACRTAMEDMEDSGKMPISKFEDYGSGNYWWE